MKRRVVSRLVELQIEEGDDFIEILWKICKRVLLLGKPQFMRMLDGQLLIIDKDFAEKRVSKSAILAMVSLLRNGMKKCDPSKKPEFYRVIRREMRFFRKYYGNKS